MKTTTLLFTPLAATAVTVVAEDRTQSFDNTSGAAPKHWTTGVTGKGEARWTVEKDATAPTGPNVLKQSGVGGLRSHFQRRAAAARRIL